MTILRVGGSDLARMLAGAQEGGPGQEEPRLPIEGHIARLRDDAARLDQRFDFKAGDLVYWKEGLGLHDCGHGPFLFRRMLSLEEQMRVRAEAQNDPANIYWAEPMDALIANVRISPNTKKEIFAEWLVPARRLQPWTGEGLAGGSA